MDYTAITQDDFDRLLLDLLKTTTAQALIRIPGIYEILAEEWNNDVLDAWEAEHAS